MIIFASNKVGTLQDLSRSFPITFLNNFANSGNFSNVAFQHFNISTFLLRNVTKCKFSASENILPISRQISIFFCWRSSPSGTQRPSRSQGTNLRGPSNFLSSVYILVQKLILLISAILKCYVSLPGNQQILQKHFLPNLTFCQAIFDFFL